MSTDHEITAIKIAKYPNLTTQSDKKINTKDLEKCKANHNVMRETKVVVIPKIRGMQPIKECIMVNIHT